MNKKTKLKILKIIIFIIVVLIMISATIYLFPVMKNLSTAEGQVAFKQKISNSGIYGVLLLFLIQVFFLELVWFYCLLFSILF